MIWIYGTYVRPRWVVVSVCTSVEYASAVGLVRSTLFTDSDTTATGATVFRATMLARSGSASILGGTLTFDPGADFQNLRVGQTQDVTLGVKATATSGEVAREDSAE